MLTSPIVVIKPLENIEQGSTQRPSIALGCPSSCSLFKRLSERITDAYCTRTAPIPIIMR